MKFLLSGTLLLLALSPLAHAKQHKHQPLAKVIDTTPVYEYVVKHQPAHVCMTQVKSGPQRTTSTILGGVVGGVIGHASSHGKHKALGTIAGAIIGSTVGHQIDHAADSYARKYNQTSSHCKPRSAKVSKVRVLQGYDVTYKYKGKLYRDFMPNKPSRYIRIAH